MSGQDIKVKQKKKNKRNIIVIGFLLICIVSMFISLRGKYLSIKEIGEQYISVFWNDFYYEYGIILANFIILFFSIYLTNRGIKKGLKSFFEEEKKEMPKLPNKSIAFIGAVILSIITSKYLINTIMLSANSTLFGETDPIFGFDIGYFVFHKPVIELAIFYCIFMVIGLTIYRTIYYVVSFNVYFEGVDRQTLKNSDFINKLLKNIILVIILIALLTLIKTQDILFQKFITISNADYSYSLYGAGFTDVTIRLGGYILLAVIMVVSVVLAIYFFKRKAQTKKIIMSLLAVPAYLIILFIVMIGFNILFVHPNELDKQKKYISYNIVNTKKAFGLNIEETQLENSGNLTLDQIEKVDEVINNIPIINKDVTLKELKKNQTEKGYYSYPTTQIGKYTINGNEQLVYITPREIINNESSKTYNSKTYEYTHGYGVILTSAVQALENGTIKYLQKEFNNNEVINIKEPRIYFGVATNDIIVTNTKNKKEFDYPISTSTSEVNSENTYQGSAGLSLGFLDRCILAINNKDLNLAFSRNITSDSKILTNRNIIKRAKTLMPYLSYDDSPYLVINNEGRLIWVLDAYTVSNQYPYSQKTPIYIDGTRKEINYIRNSVKVLIDAYDGTIEFYITDRTDPIAMAYRNIYEDLFMPLERELPKDVACHFVYPKFLFDVQQELLARYHNVRPEVLYRGDDIWDVATHITGKIVTTNGTKMNSYYAMLKTVNEKKSTLGLIIPYTMYEKQNLISYLVGSYTQEGTPKLEIYKYTADSNILGPMQLDTQIEQDERISKELSSLNVTGTKVVRNMIAIPIENTILYVEPIYQVLLNEPDVPILKKIIVASGNKVAIGEDLTEALQNLLSQYAVDIQIENTDSIDDLINAIIKANQNLNNSSNSNDWELMGRDIKKLQELIDKLQIKVEDSKKQENIDNKIILQNNIE